MCQSENRKSNDKSGPEDKPMPGNPSNLSQEDDGFSDDFELVTESARNTSGNISGDHIYSDMDSVLDPRHFSFTTPSVEQRDNQSVQSGNKLHAVPMDLKEILVQYDQKLSAMQDMIISLGEGQDRIYNQMCKYFSKLDQLETEKGLLMKRNKQLEIELNKYKDMKNHSSTSSSDTDSSTSSSDSECSDSPGRHIPYTLVKSKRKVPSSKLKKSPNKSGYVALPCYMEPMTLKQKSKKDRTKYSSAGNEPHGKRGTKVQFSQTNEFFAKRPLKPVQTRQPRSTIRHDSNLKQAKSLPSQDAWNVWSHSNSARRDPRNVRTRLTPVRRDSWKLDSQILSPTIPRHDSWFNHPSPPRQESWQYRQSKPRSTNDDRSRQPGSYPRPDDHAKQQHQSDQRYHSDSVIHGTSGPRCDFYFERNHISKSCRHGNYIRCDQCGEWGHKAKHHSNYY